MACGCAGILGARQSERAGQMIGDPRYTEIEANLRWFEERYRRALEQPADEGGWLHGEAVRREQARYRAYLAAQLEDVRGLMARVSEAP